MPLCNVVLVMPDLSTKSTALHFGCDDSPPEIVDVDGIDYRHVMGDPVPRKPRTIFYAHPDTDLVQAERHAEEFFA